MLHTGVLMSDKLCREDLVCARENRDWIHLQEGKPVTVTSQILTTGEFVHGETHQLLCQGTAPFRERSRAKPSIPRRTPVLETEGRAGGANRTRRPRALPALARRHNG
jgi:hypothetical protein